jgi:hypothetical protein
MISVCDTKKPPNPSMQAPAVPCPTADAPLRTVTAQLQQSALLAPRDGRISRHRFAPDEDELLRHLVAQHGTADWWALAQNFRGRTPRQLRDRWRHYLSPDLATGPRAERDDRLLLEKVAELGPRWSDIAQSFPGRTSASRTATSA